MKRFKSILYIREPESDYDKVTTTKVQELARQNNAEVCVAQVWEPSDFKRLLSPPLHKMADQIGPHLLEDIQEFTSTSDWQDIPVTRELLSGKAFVAVIQKVLRHSHDLVIKARHNHGKSDQLAQRLFRKCPCPVWIVGETSARKSKKVLAAVDAGDSHEEAKELNKKIIELAESLADLEQGEAHYLHSWRLEHHMMRHGPRFNMKMSDILEAQKSVRSFRQEAMSKLLEACNVTASSQTVHFVEGDIVHVVKEKLQELMIDTLVMGTVARTGIPGFFIGNSAEQILADAECSVLAVKPDGFISPVTLEENS